METLFGTPIICPVLIGRRAELTALRLLVDRAKCSQGQVVLLSGEAGIGKSRLVAEGKTYAIAQGFRLLHGNCFPGDVSCPYAPLLDLLRSHFASQSRTEIATELKPFAREFAQLIPDLVPPLPDSAPTPPLTPLGSEQEKRRLFEVLTRWFTGLAAKQPVLLIIEDMHWSDETSLELLHYLARRCAAHPLLLLLTYRSEEALSSLSHWLTQLDRGRRDLLRRWHLESQAAQRAAYSAQPSRHGTAADRAAEPVRQAGVTPGSDCRAPLRFCLTPTANATR